MPTLKERIQAANLTKPEKTLKERKKSAAQGTRDMRGIIKSYGAAMDSKTLDTHIRHREDKLADGTSVNPDRDRGSLKALYERKLELLEEQLP